MGRIGRLPQDAHAVDTGVHTQVSHDPAVLLTAFRHPTGRHITIHRIACRFGFGAGCHRFVGRQIVTGLEVDLPDLVYIAGAFGEPKAPVPADYIKGDRFGAACAVLLGIGGLPADTVFGILQLVFRCIILAPVNREIVHIQILTHIILDPRGLLSTFPIGLQIFIEHFGCIMFRNGRAGLHQRAAAHRLGDAFARIRFRKRAKFGHQIGVIRGQHHIHQRVRLGVGHGLRNHRLAAGFVDNQRARTIHRYRFAVRVFQRAGLIKVDLGQFQSVVAHRLYLVGVGYDNDLAVGTVRRELLLGGVRHHDISVSIVRRRHAVIQPQREGVDIGFTKPIFVQIAVAIAPHGRIFFCGMIQVGKVHLGRLREHITDFVVVHIVRLNGLVIGTIGHGFTVDRHIRRLGLVEGRMDGGGVVCSDTGSQCNILIVKEEITNLAPCAFVGAVVFVEGVRRGAVGAVGYTPAIVGIVVESIVGGQHKGSGNARHMPPIIGIVHTVVLIAVDHHAGGSIGCPENQVTKVRLGPGRAPFG